MMRTVISSGLPFLWWITVNLSGRTVTSVVIAIIYGESTYSTVDLLYTLADPNYGNLPHFVVKYGIYIANLQYFTVNCDIFNVSTVCIFIFTVRFFTVQHDTAGVPQFYG